MRELGLYPLGIVLAAALLVAVQVPAGVAPSPPGSGEAAGASTPAAQPPTTNPRLPAPDVGIPALGGQGRLLVTTTDALAVPNDGLRVNLTPYSEPPLGADSSFQAAVEETIGGYDAVFGLFENTGTSPIPFFTVFTNTTDLTVHLAYWPNASTLPGTTYDFELTIVGGTVWELDVNHAIFGGNSSAGRFDFGATTSTWLGGLGFSEIALYPTTSSAPASMTVPLALAVHRPSGWYLPVEAHTSFSSSGGPTWGIEGRLQHPTLPPGALVTGTSVASVPNGTVLWTGGPVAVQVALTAPASALGLSRLAVSVAVTTASGAPIPGATVFLFDTLGGNATPASVVTGPSGAASAAFGTPNVTVATTDLLEAAVTNFGYSGLAESTIALAPAQHVTVRPLSDAPAVAPGGSIDLGFEVRDATGAPVVGVYLSFGTNAGRLASAYGLTGADGTVATTFLAPNESGPVLVRAIADGDGIWGGASVNVTVRPPPSPLLSAAEVDLVALGVVVAAIVVGVLVVQRRRSGRPPVPPLRLPRPPPKGPSAGAPPGEGRSSPLSRTPPGAGGS